jgi:trafficking protein particle complex subunit 11
MKPSMILLLTVRLDFTQHPNWHYDLTKSLQGLEAIKARPTVVLHEKEVNSFLSATYAFEYSEGKVGELCSSQLAVISSAMPMAAPMTMAEIKLSFEGSMKPLILRHVSNANEAIDNSRNISFSNVTLTEISEEGRASFVGQTSLIFRAGQTRVFEFSTALREAGDGTALSATFLMNTDLFDLEYIHTFEPSNAPGVWWGAKSGKKRLVRQNAAAITVLPKPPKLELRFLGLREQYYTNEQIVLQLEVVNEEDVDALANLDVRLLGEGVPSVELKVLAISTDAEDGLNGEDSIGTSLGRIASAASTIVEISIPPVDLPAVYDISIKATYSLVSDLETPIYRSMAMQLDVASPFEANYDFSPRIHPSPWPSLFTHVEGEDTGTDIEPHGLAQKWCLNARYASFAADELVVEDVDVQILGMNGGIQCYTKQLTKIPEKGLPVAPKSLEEAQFEVFTQKVSLDDRGTATLDVSLAIKWRRSGEGSALNTTILGVPRLLVASTEPRVLAAVSYSTKIPSMIHFDVTIENPSNHFLTFGITMEPSEKFAFSGVKQSTLQLVPLSRKSMRFRLLPSVRGEWIGPIHCVIRDRYFQKVLKIAPTEGMRLDKEGILIWVPPEEDL